VVKLNWCERPEKKAARAKNKKAAWQQAAFFFKGE
jgi:hypothetical protein